MSAPSQSKAEKTLPQRLGTWLRKSWVIVVIVVAALVASAVVSKAEVDAHQDLTAVLSGDLLVVSVAIFLAAVAAAIYAKPAYDAARALLRPPKMKLKELSVSRAGAPITSQPASDGRRIFYVGAGVRDVGVTVTIESDEEADSAARPITGNLFIALPCRVAPSSTGRGHNSVVGDPMVPLLGADAFLPVSATRVETDLLPSLTILVSANVTLPTVSSPWAEGWPMRVTARAANLPIDVVDETWWLSPADGPNLPGLPPEESAGL